MNTIIPSDEQTAEPRWILEAQQGDLDAFNRLVTFYQDRVFNTAYRIMGGFDEAEDAAQKAFISAYRNIKSYRGGSFKAWLLKVTVNACYDELRKSKRQPVVSIDDDTRDDYLDLVDRGLPDPAPSPQQISEMRELHRAVQYCLQDLPPDFRAVAVLADVEELDYEEISRITGNPLGTVKSRLARARQKLRGCLQDFWELLPLAIRQKYEGA
ncbi:MAG: sigma-70 family RNA polymerase sigma factor [Chloroflexi bacterium]|nr:sigma-70 family RNA polymerase sigma factor [Chloroflexota bacterium]